MSNPNDPRYPSTGPGPQQQQRPQQPPGPWPQQAQPQPHYPPAGHYPQQPYAGQQPYPYQYGPAPTTRTSAGAVIGLGALGGVLAYLVVGIPVGLLFDVAIFNIPPQSSLRALTVNLPRIGIPSIAVFIVYSALLGALVGAMRLGIRNGAAMIGAGILFGLLLRTGLAMGALGPLLSGQLRFNLPLLSWVKILLSNGLWGLGTAAFLIMTTRR